MTSEEKTKKKSVVCNKMLHGTCTEKECLHARPHSHTLNCDLFCRVTQQPAKCIDPAEEKERGVTKIQ